MWIIIMSFCSDCSRFWECGPPEWSGTQWMYETCLFECARCQRYFTSKMKKHTD